MPGFSRDVLDLIITSVSSGLLAEEKISSIYNAALCGGLLTKRNQRSLFTGRAIFKQLEHASLVISFSPLNPISANGYQAKIEAESQSCIIQRWYHLDDPPVLSKKGWIFDKGLPLFFGTRWWKLFLHVIMDEIEKSMK